MDTKTKKILAKIFNIFSIMVLIVAMGLLLFIVTSKISNKTPQVFGYSLHFVVTESMEDEIMVGDLVVGKKTDVMNIKEGDDIIFVSPDPSLKGMIIVHRIRRIDDSGDTRRIYTYGINNSKDDNVSYPVTEIIGKVSAVSTFWGKVFNPTTIIFIVIIFGVALVFYYSVKYFLKARRELKSEDDEDGTISNGVVSGGIDSDIESNDP